MVVVVPTDGVAPRIKSLFGKNGLQIYDPIEDGTAILETNTSVDPQPSSTERFVYPVGTAVSVEVTSLVTPRAKGIWVRDNNGDVVREVHPNDEAVTFDAATYFIEFSGFAMKVYARVEAGFTVIPREEELQVLLDPDTEVELGVRSLHKQPARTVSTTRSPQGMMQAISLFGNSMKTWGPERTFPTLRGHPPLVEFGEKTAFDKGHTPPDTGIEIRVPAEYEWVYPVAPLAHWLGATVKQGSEAVLETNDEIHSLGSEAGYTARSPRLAFELHVRDILQYTFMLETSMRQTYDEPPAVRGQVEEAEIGLELDSLYGQPIDERLQRELDALPFPRVEERLDRPDWQLTANVEPRAERGTVVPFLARDLAVVRAMPEPRIQQLEARGDSGASLFDHGGTGETAWDGGETMTRAPRDSVSGAGNGRVIRSLPDSTSFSQAWAGPGFAEGAATVSSASYLRRLENLADEKQQISVDVIVNERDMAAEEAVLDVYGSREQPDFGVSYHEQLTQAELADVLASNTDFIHYVGHVTSEGFECRDGVLDGASLDSVGVDMFVLNACASYEQGQHLVDSSAIAGVVTLNDVISSAATNIGMRFAQLLNHGFPVGAATDLIRETKLLANQYSVVGDSTATLAQPSGATTVIEQLSLGPEDCFQVEKTTYASWTLDVGSVFIPHYDEKRVTVPKQWGPVTISEAELQKALDCRVFPIVAGDTLYWSDRTTVEELRAELT